ncbi:hypothetical protein G6011_05381 [Alternaria panax]|uniref:Uncharacterized protein n=1 Tax=Alternaria panax TaxID=48097 RepID=A0AAD4FCJ6_9PLEO|nr:hypothetical protein G6011_05381 [Alternaria panax]
MTQGLSTAPSKPGERTKKFQQRKHLTSYWEVLGDKLRARRKKDSKPKSSDTEDDNPRHSQGGGGPLTFAQHGNNMFPPQRLRNAPNQASHGPFQDQGQAESHQQQPQFHDMPSMANARALQSGETDPHLQRGGQTEYGERPRGQGQNVYVDAERPVPGGAQSGGASDSRQPKHPWMPETQHYEQERTRMR